MFISEEELRKRIGSESNLLNIIRKVPPPITPSNLTVPEFDPPLVKENLPEETNRQRAARHARGEIKQETRHGEYVVNPNIDNDILRSTIGILASQTSSQQVQKEFGLTKNQVTGAKKSKKKSIQDRIESGKNKISELAIDRLMETLGLISTDKLINVSAKDLSTISSNLANVVQKSKEADKMQRAGANVTLSIYAPEVTSSDKYRVIDV